MQQRQRDIAMMTDQSSDNVYTHTHTHGAGPSRDEAQAPSRVSHAAIK